MISSDIALRIYQRLHMQTVIATNLNNSDFCDFGLFAGQQEPGCVVRCVRGKKMQNITSLFDEFSSALQFPYYFGENWAAFDECLNDLTWMEGESYLLLIANAESLLAQENNRHECLDIFFEYLNRAVEDWGSGVNADGKPIAFRIILSCPFESGISSSEVLRCAADHFAGFGVEPDNAARSNP